MRSHMTKLRKLFVQALLLFAVSALTGCAVVAGGNFKPAAARSDVATVYVMRPYYFDVTMISAGINIDGKRVASLGLNEGQVVRLSAGKHEVTVDAPMLQPKYSYPSEPFFFEVNAGDVLVLTLDRVILGYEPVRSQMGIIPLGGKPGFIPVYSQTGGAQIGSRFRVETYREAVERGFKFDAFRVSE